MIIKSNERVYNNLKAIVLLTVCTSNKLLWYITTFSNPYFVTDVYKKAFQLLHTCINGS